VPPTPRSRVANLTLPPFDPLNARAAELRRQGHPVISMGQAVPGFAPPAVAAEAIRASLDAPGAHLYSTDPGLLSLRTILGERLREHSIDVDPQEIIITAGGNHAFALATLTLLDPGDEVLLPSPYFTNQDMMLRVAGVSPREVPLEEANGFALRWRDLEPHLTARTRAVVFCTPSNPTGAVIDRDEGTRIVAELSRRRILVISDETYMPFVYGAQHWSAASVAGWRDNVVVVGTFSKSFAMTGWRVGYLLAARELCVEAVKVQDAMIICAPVTSQRAAEAALRHAPDYPAQFLPELHARRALLRERLQSMPRLRWTKTAGGFFAFVRVDGCEDSARLATELLEREYVVTLPGSTFGAAGEGYLRLSYGAATQTELREALDRVARFCGR
jgi:aminotransferase